MQKAKQPHFGHMDSCVDTQKAACFERNFCVNCASCIITLLTMDLY